MAARFLLAIALVASIWPFVGSGDAHACSCLQPTLEELVARAELVVLGTVQQIDQVERDPTTFPYEYDLTLDADEYLKGLGPDRFHIQQFGLGSDCDTFDPDSVGQQYLLFLSHWEGNLRTGACTGSGRVRDTDVWQERIEEVRQIVREPEQSGDTPALTVTPSAPQLPATGSGSDNDSSLPIFAAIATAVGVLGAGLLLGVRRLRGS
ncbi:MAG: hypothetical protein IIB22_07560 [Chloroflexi bacterium]|nr:hypothetical protein [Chloroflexota bacterium]